MPDHRRFPDPVIVPAASGFYPWGTAGTAFDYRIRYLYRATDPRQLVAVHGARLLAALEGGTEPGKLWQELTEALPAWGTAARRDAGDLELVRMCVVLSWFEQLFRVGPAALASHPLLDAGKELSLGEALDLVPEVLVDDVAAMTSLFLTRHPGMLAAGRVTLNPTFARSFDLGGADADLILDGQLIDLKTTKSITLRAEVVWQLLGYLLADTDDVHRIDRVGLYFARHGVLWSFPVPWFLSRLAGHDVDLAQARAEFADACAPPPPTRPLATAEVDTPARRRRLGPMRRPGPARVERPLAFYPSLSGSGLRHALAADACPDQWRLNAAQAACRSGLVLDVDADPVRLVPGDVGDAPRLCRQCLAHATIVALPEPLTELTFCPPADGGGRWHVRAGGCGYYFRGDPDAPACGTPGLADASAEPVTLTVAEASAAEDPRLCRRCIAALTA